MQLNITIDHDSKMNPFKKRGSQQLKTLDQASPRIFDGTTPSILTNRSSANKSTLEVIVDDDFLR